MKRIRVQTRFYVDPATGLLKSLRIDITYAKDDKPYRKGDETVLHQRYTDFNSKNILARLGELDELEALTRKNDLLSWCHTVWDTPEAYLPGCFRTASIPAPRSTE